MIFQPVVHSPKDGSGQSQESEMPHCSSRAGGKGTGPACAIPDALSGMLAKSQIGRTAAKTQTGTPILS